MHIVLVAWLYVALLVAATEPTLVGSVMSLIFYGLLPVAIIAYIGTTGQRKKRRRLKKADGGPGESGPGESGPLEGSPGQGDAGQGGPAGARSLAESSGQDHGTQP